MNLSTDPRAELRKKLLRRMLWKVPLVFLLMSLAVWWQMRRENQIPVEGSQQGLAKAAEFTGAWRGEVTYHWGAKHTEHFFFQPEANKLFGTATFLGAKRGIEEGQIIGETATFSVTFEEISGSMTRQRRNRYEAKLSGGEIQLKIIDDQGNALVEMVLAKSASAP